MKSKKMSLIINKNNYRQKVNKKTIYKTNRNKKKFNSKI